MVGKLPEITSNVKLKFKLFPEIYGLGGHTKVEDVKASETLMISVNTSTSGGDVKKIKGSANQIELNLKIPIVGFKGDNVGIARNIGGHWRLIGYGEIL